MADRTARQRSPAGSKAADTPVFSGVAVVASCVGFVLIGALQALYGPAIPALRERFDLTPSAAGLALSAHFVGGVTGALLFGSLNGRIGNRRTLGGSYLLMAIGAAGFAMAPDWPVALAMALLAGLGFGGVDYGLNQLFATGFGRRSTAMLNILNAHFGVGAVLGPAVIGAVGSERYAAVFLGFALVALPLLLCLGGVRDTGAPETDGHAPPVSTGARIRNRSLGTVLAAFVVLYVLHVGIEAGVGGWEPTHLETVGFGAGAAATATSVYWLMMTVNPIPGGTARTALLRTFPHRCVLRRHDGLPVAVLDTGVRPVRIRGRRPVHRPDLPDRSALAEQGGAAGPSSRGTGDRRLDGGRCRRGPGARHDHRMVGDPHGAAAARRRLRALPAGDSLAGPRHSAVVREGSGRGRSLDAATGFSIRHSGEGAWALRVRRPGRTPPRIR